MSEAPSQLEFAQRFVPNQRRIYGFILTIVPNANEADEVFQETSLILWKKVAEFDPQLDFVKWSCGIAANVIRNRQAKKSRDRHVFSDELLAKIAELRHENQRWLDDRVTTLAQCLERLGQAQRGLLLLFYGGEQSVADLAVRERLTENALRQRMHRIRRRLFDCVTHAMNRSGAT